MANESYVEDVGVVRIIFILFGDTSRDAPPGPTAGNVPGHSLPLGHLWLADVSSQICSDEAAEG